MSNWKREVKKEEKRRQLKYVKKTRKKNIEKALEDDESRKIRQQKKGPLKSLELKIENFENTIKRKSFRINRK